LGYATQESLATFMEGAAANIAAWAAGEPAHVKDEAVLANARR
jgi:hypothetical protein